jgi:pantoate--beta-alanine ligase
MKVFVTIAELRSELASRRADGQSVGLVPTMGALHEGHLALLRAARAECDTVVMSLFVNPTQFAPGEDFATYPRDRATDEELALEAGVDLLFAPDASEVYPAGFSTSVIVRGLTEQLEGTVRGGAHFEGVATVVTKLLNIVAPDVAYFGQKDAQQAVVIARLVRDLDIPVRIAVCPTVREADGLARSSRNVYLDGAQRARAASLSQALDRAGALIAAGESQPAAVLEAARLPLAAASIDPDYFAIVDPDTLEAVDAISGPVLVAVAAQVGRAHLIDNIVATPTPASTPTPTPALIPTEAR